MRDWSQVLYAKVLTPDKYDSTRLDQKLLRGVGRKNPRGLKISIDSSGKLRTREAEIDLLQNLT